MDRTRCDGDPPKPPPLRYSPPDFAAETQSRRHFPRPAAKPPPDALFREHSPYRDYSTPLSSRRPSTPARFPPPSSGKYFRWWTPLASARILSSREFRPRLFALAPTLVLLRNQSAPRPFAPSPGCLLAPR